MTTATQNIQETAREAVIQSEDIQQDIRQLVIQGLKEGKLEPDAIKQTIHSVIEGASEGNNSQFDENTEALEQVVMGIDAALGQVAVASKLAIEEANGNLQEFSDHDLKRALNDLQDLERLFFDTLSEVAHQSKDTTGETLVGLLEHLQNSGSSVDISEILFCASTKGTPKSSRHPMRVISIPACLFLCFIAFITASILMCSWN